MALLRGLFGAFNDDHRCVDLRGTGLEDDPGRPHGYITTHAQVAESGRTAVPPEEPDAGADGDEDARRANTARAGRIGHDQILLSFERRYDALNGRRRLGYWRGGASASDEG
jgi:hypothetical protein